MKSFLKQINESFQSLEESLDSKTAANDPKLFVKTAYDNGYSEKQIENFLQKAGHSKDDAETYLYNIVGQYDTGFASNGINEAAKQSKTSKAAIQSAAGKNRDDWEYKTCENCSGKLTSHIKGVCQRCKTEPRWQDNDGDGKWYEPGVDVKEAKGKYDDGDGKDEKCDYVPCNEGDLDNSNIEKIECDKCNGAGCDHCNGTGYHKKVDEVSVAAGAGSYMTPKAFGKRTNPNLKQSTGYTDVPKTKLHTEYDYVQEAMDRKYEQLIEGYRDFVLSDSKMSPARKVNASIRDVAKKLKEIEKIVEYTGRLKTESGIAHSGFSSGTHNALRKISERLIKISERVRSLGE